MLSTTVKSVLDIQKKRLDRDASLKNKILTNIKDRIGNYAKHGQTKCVFQIPSFIFGYSPYDISEVTMFIIKKLDSEGFYLQLYPNNIILISWDVRDIKKRQRRKEKERRNIDDLVPLMSIK